MSYNFTPLSDEEINSIGLLKEGNYSFEVIKSTRKVSKSGNPMAELQILLWDNEGKQHTVFDYLVFSHVNLNIKKVKHFCDATGLKEEYKKGQLPENLERLAGNAIIGIRDEQPKPNGGFYPRKNYVIDYIESNPVTSMPSSSPEFKPEEELNDDIPF